MLKFAIFEKNAELARTLFEQATAAVNRLQISCELNLFTDIEKLVSKLKKDIRCFHAFLLNASDKQSMNLAMNIRRKNLSASFVFLLQDPSTELSALLQYRPSAAVTADDEICEQLLASIYRVNEEQKFANPFFAVKTREEIMRINYTEILYFESNKRIVTLYTNKMSVDFYGKLNDIQQTLPAQMFMRCHQSYLINIEKVVRLDKSNRLLRLRNGCEIEISKSSYPQVLQQYEAFVQRF